ncbi:hypothetical protein BGZ90_009245 [Linnemannia elongata]|nr:hypothetical protein BGZ90_009245 [Linnemannia elongata]
MQMAPTSSTRFFEMPELVIHLIPYLDPPAISCLMQTSRHLNHLTAPALYYNVQAVYEPAPVKWRRNIFTSAEAVRALGRNAGHVRQLDLEPLEATYYVNCAFAYQQQQQQQEEERDLPNNSHNNDNDIKQSESDFRTHYHVPHKDCPYFLLKFCDPKATLTYICWIMNSNPHLLDLSLEILVKDNRDIRLLTTSIFGLKKVKRVDLELVYWPESVNLCRWVPVLFGCCPVSLERFVLELIEGSDFWTWPFMFDRLQSEEEENVPVWQMNDQDCGLLETTTMNLPMRQEPLTNLNALMLYDLCEEIVLEEEFRSVLEQCPNLEYITMPTVAPIRNPKRLAQEMVRCCPKLKSVEQRYGIEGVEIWETMLWLLEVLPENQLWRFIGTFDQLFVVPGFPQDAGLLFCRHSMTLRSIALGGCRNFNSKAIQMILMGCGAVERLEVQWSMKKDTRQHLCLELEDAVQVPWACTGLKGLTLTVAIPDQPLHYPPEGVVPFYNRASPATLSEAETHQFELLEALYRQIGTLTELHTLVLRAIFYDPQGHRLLAKDYRQNSFPGFLNLKSETTGRPGYLHHLGGLTKLRKLGGSVSMTTYETGVTVKTTDEPEWMAQHWPVLTEAQFYSKDERIGTQFQWLKDEVAKQSEGRRKLIVDYWIPFH